MRLAAFLAGLLFATAALAGPPVTLRGPAPDVGLDFIHNVALAPGCGPTATSCITDVRASTKWCDFKNGNWVSAAANVPCITDRGLLVEDPATNYLRNNAMVGAVVASPGTLPTNWVDNMAGPLNGISRSVVGVGVENGIDYIDIRYAGTATSQTTINLNLETNTAIATVKNHAWTASAFAYLKAGSYNGLTVKLIMYGLNAGQTVSEGPTPGVAIAAVGSALGLSRSVTSYTLTSVSTVTIKPVLAFVITNGAVLDATLRIGWPQMEAYKGDASTGVTTGFSSQATSPIRTTAAAVTRAAEKVTLTNPPAFGGSYTMYAAAVPEVGDAAPFLMLTGSYGNMFGMGLGAGPALLCLTNTFQISKSNNSWYKGQPLKAACSANPNGVSGNRLLSLNGGDYITASDTVSTPQTLGAVTIGGDAGGGSYGSDVYIAAVGIWATVQLSADTLKTITAPSPNPAPDVWLDFTDNYASASSLCGPTATGCITDTRASSHACDFTNGNWVTVGNNVPCITDKGFLVEDFATNSLRNNSMQGAIIAAPGTLPTNWLDNMGAPVNGISRSVVGLGTENGIDYIDVRYSGTATLATTINMDLETNTAIAAVKTQAWSASAFIYLLAGSYNGLTVNFTIVGLTSGQVISEQSAGGLITTVAGSLGLARSSYAYTLAAATTAKAKPVITFTVTNGAVVDATFRIGWPQFERANSPAGVTSPIRTTNAVGIRQGDVTLLKNPPAFGAGYSAYVAGNTTGGDGYPLTIWNNTGNGDFIQLVTNRGYQVAQTWFSSQYNTDIYNSTNSLLSFQPYKIAVAARPDGVSPNFGMSFNGGGFVIPDTIYGFAPQTFNSVYIGADSYGDPSTGYITQVGIWPTQRLPDDALIGLTR